MVKFRTVIVPRVKKQGKKKTQQTLAVILIILNIIFSSILPFVLGFYFGTTREFIYFILFLFMLFFEVRFSMDNKGNISIRIVRGL